MSESLSLAQSCANLKDNDVLEIDLELFEQLYARAVKGDLSHEEEGDVVEIASLAMTSSELDENVRELFQSAYFILNKKNKPFFNVREMRRSRRRC